jgi:hypothetical protein
MHTSLKDTANAQTCEFCDDKFENFIDLKMHLKPHSYKKATYACKYCDFVADQPITMEVHLGKSHSESFECGLCNLEAKDLETLETHLFTCELYICYSCDKRFNNLGDIKKHIEVTHKKASLFHVKIDRNDPNDISDILYSSDEV